MTSIDVYRQGSPPTLELTISLDDSAIFTKRLMAEWNVTVPYVSNVVLDLQIGDYIVLDSVNYYITRVPDVEKLNNSTFRYSLVFQSVFSELQTRLNFSTDGLTEYDYTGTADDFLKNLVALVADLGWSVGTVDTTLPQNMTFSNEYCSASLVRIAEQFKMEFEIVGRVINLKNAVGTDTTLTFEYGQGNGLYNLTRQQVQDQNILTKVWGFGGTRNIASDYRNRSKRLVFETEGNRFLTKNVDLYGTIEGQFTDDNIFPQRTGTITGGSILFDETTPFDFDSANSYVEDSALDFDINSYLLEGQTAKIVFKTGAMAGLECEINRYDNATKRIYFNPYVDPNDGYVMPRYNEGSPLIPEIDDTYTLVDIKMPQSYIDTAEAALQVATQAFIDENSVPQVVYSCSFDPQYVKTIAVPKVGDRVTIVDTDLGVNALIRISGLEYPLINPNKITATIADFVPYTLQERIIKQTINNKKETIFVDRRSAYLARANTVRQNQLKDLIFDTDGYFDTGNIKPLSIETSMISVGVRSQDFQLSGVTIQPNYLGDENRIAVSTGTLFHNQLSVTGLGSEWIIGTAIDEDLLTPASAYYLYAKCNKSALTAEWILDPLHITVEQVAGYYHLLVGVLFSVVDNVRDYDFTYGMTYINGRTISTGRIRSVNGLNYFDLDYNQFKLGDSTSSIDWNVTTPSALNIKGAILTDTIVAEGAEIQNLVARRIQTDVVPNARVTVNMDNLQQIATYDGNGDLKILIKPTAIQTIAEIAAGTGTESDTPTAVSTATQSTEFGTIPFGIETYEQLSTEFAIALTGIIEVEVENIDVTARTLYAHFATGYASVSVYLQKETATDVWTDMSQIGSVTGTTAHLASRTIMGMTAGNYRLIARHTHYGYFTDPVTADEATITCESFWAYTAGESFTITTRKVVAQTEIGNNGFCSVWAANKYFHYTQDGLFIKDGDYEFSLTDAGMTDYVLPTATDSVLGGVKIGNGVTITDGVISVSTDYLATDGKAADSDLLDGHDTAYFAKVAGDSAQAFSTSSLRVYGAEELYFGDTYGYRSLTVRGFSNYPSIVFEKNDGVTIGAIRANPTGDMLLVVPSGTTGIKAITLATQTGAATFASSVSATQFKLSALNTAPSSATDTGTAGEIRITSTYIYVCTATNTWVRSALTTW